jgi:hypothetical protein
LCPSPPRGEMIGKWREELRELAASLVDKDIGVADLE